MKSQGFFYLGSWGDELAIYYFNGGESEIVLKVMERERKKNRLIKEQCDADLGSYAAPPDEKSGWLPTTNQKCGSCSTTVSNFTHLPSHSVHCPLFGIRHISSDCWS